MIKKVCLAAVLAAGMNNQVSAIDFQPTAALLINRTITQNYTTVNSGAFDIQNRNMNFGFEVTNKFQVKGDYFIKSGVRFGQYKNSFRGNNELPGYTDNPSPIVWERKYTSVAIPVLFGRDFASKKGNKGDYFVGMSMGMLMTSYAKTMASSITPLNPNNTDTVSSFVYDASSTLPSYFMPTVDFGANYQPFSSLPGFNVGVLLSAQLNKTEPYTLQGSVTAGSPQKEYKYNLTHQQQLINCAVSLSYTFGRHKQAAVSNLNEQ